MNIGDGQVIRFIGGWHEGTTTDEMIDILLDRLTVQQGVLADGFTMQRTESAIPAERRRVAEREAAKAMGGS